jgi:hypothetical protein
MAHSGFALSALHDLPGTDETNNNMDNRYSRTDCPSQDNPRGVSSICEPFTDTISHTPAPAGSIPYYSLEELVPEPIHFRCQLFPCNHLNLLVSVSLVPPQ